MRRAFTIVELLAAMGLLGVLLAVSGVIFGAAVKAYRTAQATAEISRKLAAITDQLNADFMGLQKDAPFDCPFAIWFEEDPCNPGVRHDQILFFADGDFQSYSQNTPMFVGNVARVYYGQANIMDVDYQSDPPVRDLEEPYEQADILARRQHIYFPPDPCLPAFPVITNITEFETSFTPENNDFFEYDNITLSQWKVITNDPCYNNQIIQTCFSNTSPEGRPGIDLDNAETLHMLMAQGVGYFRIEWAYFWEGELSWFPSDDPDGDPCTNDSDFGLLGMDKDAFGVYFNMAGGVNVDMSDPPDGSNDWSDSGGTRTQGFFFPSDFFPRAIKFTFTLYDSQGIFREGKRFTHIVYLD